MTYDELTSKVQTLIDEAGTSPELEVRLAIAEIALSTAHEFDYNGQIILYSGMYLDQHNNLFFGGEA